MSRIKFEGGSHFYTHEGKPQHDADLRVARKERLYRSITSIDKDEFVNEFLQNWKVEQACYAAALSPRQPHESEDDYAQRVYELSLEYSKNAAEFGSKVHDSIEHYPMYPLDDTIKPWFDEYAKWHEENVEDIVASEKVVVDHGIGVAGRLDKILVIKGVGRCVVDVKTQNLKKDDKGKKKVNWYDSWVRQLSFYAVCDAKETKSFPASIPRCASLVIDSNEPERPFLRVWDEDLVHAAYKQVVVAAWRYYTKKKFFPHKYGMFDIAFTVPMPNE